MEGISSPILKLKASTLHIPFTQDLQSFLLLDYIGVLNLIVLCIMNLPKFYLSFYRLIIL